MFQEEYIRDLGSNYLVLSEEGKAYDEFQINMLMNNKIVGLLECEIRVIDGNERFLYEISSKQPLSRIYEKAEMDYDALVSVLRGIARAVESAKEYLLDTGHFILQPEYMYINPETGKLFLCFYPQYYMESGQAFHQLAEYILDKVDHKDQKGVVLAYDFYKKVKEDNFNIRSVMRAPISFEENAKGNKDISKNINKDRSKNSEEKYVNHNQKEIGSEEVAGDRILYMIGITILIVLVLFLLWIQIYQPVFLTHSRKMQKIVLLVAGGMGGVVALISFVIANRIYNRKSRGKIILTEEEIQNRYHAEGVPYCGNTTMLVQSGHREQPKLIHMKNGKLQEIMIQGTPFVIGKMEKGVDAVIKERSISRMHARISEKEGCYYLTDLNSTNGTYKNGVRLNANETTAIKGDDEIKLADLTFYFACC